MIMTTLPNDQHKGFLGLTWGVLEFGFDFAVGGNLNTGVGVEERATTVDFCAFHIRVYPFLTHRSFSIAMHQRSQTVSADLTMRFDTMSERSNCVLSS